MADWPRPFVFRARGLAGKKVVAGDLFCFQVNLFELSQSMVEAFTKAFELIGGEGLGPQRTPVVLERISQPSIGPLVLAPSAPSDSVTRVKVQFMTPTELKSAQAAASGSNREAELDSFGPPGGESAVRGFLSSAKDADARPEAMKGTRRSLRGALGAASVLRGFLSSAKDADARHQPDQTVAFDVLANRIRDRISNLRQLYGSGPLEIDFRDFAKRAARVELVFSNLNHLEVWRRSTRTGQKHALGGFVGQAEYQGDLAEFIPYLEAACWAGVGRQTVWGKGEIAVGTEISPAEA